MSMFFHFAPDSEGGVVVPNYSTWSLSDQKGHYTLSEDLLTVTSHQGYWDGIIRSTVGHATGKHRMKFTGGSSEYTQFGISAAGSSVGSFLGSSPYAWGVSSHGYIYNNNSYTGPTHTFGPSTVIDMYLNLDDNLLNIFYDETHAYVDIDISSRGSRIIHAAFSGYQPANTGSANFGQTSLGSPKTGFETYREGFYTP